VQTPLFTPEKGQAFRGEVRRSRPTLAPDHAGWVVTLHSPDEQEFYGRTLEEALAWCLVWLMAPELGVEPFAV
jgi:hypothetical protein